MARTWTSIDDIVNDYMISMDDEDYGATQNPLKVRNIAIGVMKQLVNSGAKVMKSQVLQVNSTTNSVELPNDFYDYCRVGVINVKGQFIPMVANGVLERMYQEPLFDNLDAKLLDSDGVELTALKQYGTQSATGDDSRIRYVSQMQGAYGGNFGLSGGNSQAGTYRVDLRGGRMYFSTNMKETEVVLEYLADESMSSTPQVHYFLETAMMAGIYSELIHRKSNVPPAEKVRARKAFSREKELALNNMRCDKSKAEIIARLMKHSQLAPRTGTRIYR